MSVLSSTDGTTTISYAKSGNPFAGPPTEADSYTASAHFASNNGNYTDADSTVAASLIINNARLATWTRTRTAKPTAMPIPPR